MGFDLVEKKLAAERMARATADKGGAAEIVMNNLTVVGFFDAQATEILQGIRCAPPENLDHWRIRLRLLEDFESAIRKAMNAGQANARSLAAVPPTT